MDGCPAQRSTLVELPDQAVNGARRITPPIPDFFAERGQGTTRYPAAPRRREHPRRVNLYPTFSDDVSSNAQALATLFAAHSAIALGHVQERTRLSEALQSRKIMGQAVGILMERYEMNEDRAFAFMVRASSHGNVKVRDVAQGLVDEATTGSSARRACFSPPPAGARAVQSPLGSPVARCREGRRLARMRTVPPGSLGTSGSPTRLNRTRNRPASEETGRIVIVLAICLLRECGAIPPWRHVSGRR